MTKKEREKAVKAIVNTPDEELQGMLFSLNHTGEVGALTYNGLSYSKNVRYAVDEEGFPVGNSWDKVPGTISNMITTISDLQEECWIKFNTNPQISTSVVDNGGIVCGKGFSISSPYLDVDEWVGKFMKDPRNKLIANLKKMYMRSEIEGELFLAFSVHYGDGFVETDFMDPRSLNRIYYHPFKRTMPLFYEFNIYSDSGEGETFRTVIIPSIYLFEYPDLIQVAAGMTGWDKEKLFRYDKKKFKKTNGFQTFIISWDKSLFTERNVSQMRTTIEWTNHYENLKRYEIDHKKASGYYANVVSFEDVKAFKRWLSLSDEERKKTGIEQKKTPGGTIILPPGMKLDIKNPQLQRISEQDTDIMHMITAGLNKPEDMVTGQSNGTYGSVKATRGPESDRNANRRQDFEIFLRYDFFRSAFLLSSAVKKIKTERSEECVVDFKDGEDVMGKKVTPIWESLEITFPVSEVSDVESTTKALLGVKHGSLTDVLGIPNSLISEKLGMSNYRSLRLKAATEKLKYPELVMAGVDSNVIDANAESTNLEPPAKLEKPKPENQNNDKKLKRRTVPNEKTK